jgi:hypothetical protein
MSDHRRTSYARATAGFDEAHERQLVEALTAAVVETSRASDCDAVLLRTGEIASALLTVLAGTLAMSPASVRSPTAIRRTVDELRRRITQAERDPELQDFMRRCFRDDVGGHA